MARVKHSPLTKHEMMETLRQELHLHQVTSGYWYHIRLGKETDLCGDKDKCIHVIRGADTLA